MALLFIIIAPICAFFGSLLARKNIRTLSGVTIVASVIELVSSFAVFAAVTQNGTYNFSSYFSIDALGAVVMMLVAIVGTMASWYSVSYVRIEMEKKIIGPNRVREYFLLLHLFILAMFFAIMTTNPILMWIAIEATTLSTAFLISFYNKPDATEAAWKYLIINSVGLLLGFFGALLFLSPAIHSGFQGLTNWKTLFSSAALLDPGIAKIAFVFVLIGFGTKVGLVPMHTWLPDAHSKAPAPISSLLSGVLLNVAFLAVLRFKSVTDAAIGSDYSRDLLIIFGLASIIVAAFIIFMQKNYKRLLAYHSVEHMGIIALGFGFGGLGSTAALLHMIYHSLAKSALFLSSGNILLKYNSTKIKNVKGLIKTLPVTSVLFFIGFLVMAGVPPFGIFITEFSILSAGISEFPILAAMALLSFALVFAGILEHLSAMSFGEADKEITKGEAGVWTTIPVIVLISVLVLLSFYIPDSLQLLLHAATMNY